MDPDAVPLYASKVQMCHILRLEDCSNQKKSHRSDHGISIRLGPILKYMDICACLSAERLAKTSCVTLSMDHLVFDDTIQVSDGEAMIIEAKVVRSFNSSAEVLAEVFIDGLGPVDGTCFAHAYFIFVRVDKGKMPVTFPQNSREIQEFLMSMERRKARQTKNVMMSAAQVQFDDNFSAITTPYAEPTDQAFRTPADCSLLKFTHVVLPPHANHMGNTFGGQIMEWAEEAASLAATRHLRHSVHVEPHFSVSTIFVDGFTFLRPSTVGDRIVVRAQCTRAFGPLLEVEVIAFAVDVTGASQRHIVTGNFSICVRRLDGSDFPVCDVSATTREQQQRYRSALGRMLVAAIRYESVTGTLAPPSLLPVGSSTGSGSAQITFAAMRAAHRESIWTVPLPSTMSLSAEFDLQCVLQLSLQDLSGLLYVFSEQAKDVDTWETLDDTALGSTASVFGSTFDSPNSLRSVTETPCMRMRRSNGVVQLMASVIVPSPVCIVEQLLLDLSRRSEWDSILVGEVINSVTDSVDIIWMGTTRPPLQSVPTRDEGNIGDVGAESSMKGTDYALLRSRTTLSDGRVSIVSRSILSAEVPHRPLFRRGEILPSGFLLTPQQEQLEEQKQRAALHNSKPQLTTASEPHSNAAISFAVPELVTPSCTRLEYLVQMDATSASYFATELEGSTRAMRLSLGRLASIL